MLGELLRERAPLVGPASQPSRADHALTGETGTHHSHGVSKRRVLLALSHDPPEKPPLAVLLLLELDVVDVWLGALRPSRGAHT